MSGRGVAQVKSDDKAVEKHLRSNPRSNTNNRGYPHWDTHPAKKIWKLTGYNLHERMEPRQLRKMRDAYKEFPSEVFTKRVFVEIAKQKAATFWAFKRNKKGMQMYLKNFASQATSRE